MKIAEPTKWTTLNLPALADEIEFRPLLDQAIFWRLINHMLRTGDGLPDDITRIQSLLMLTKDAETNALHAVLRWNFKTAQKQGVSYYYHPAVKDAMVKAAAAVARKRENGRKGGQKTQRRNRTINNVTPIK